MAEEMLGLILTKLSIRRCYVPVPAASIAHLHFSFATTSNENAGQQYILLSLPATQLVYCMAALPFLLPRHWTGRNYGGKSGK
ncbi:hypothetical protein V8C42DRAFT_325300 [Trichoderma barbatum]